MPPVTVTGSDCSMTALERPISMSYSPLGICQRPLVTSKNANARSPRVTVTVADSPAARCTLANPRSSRTGRGTTPLRSRTYTWITSLPLLSPVFVTGTVTATVAPAVISAWSRDAGPYSNVV